MPQPHAEYAAPRLFHLKSVRTYRPRSFGSILLSFGRLLVLTGLYASLTALPCLATCASPQNPIEAENCLSCVRRNFEKDGLAHIHADIRRKAMNIRRSSSDDIPFAGGIAG